jgi:hypothetical protein
MFHSKDGLFFEHLPFGDLRIFKQTPDGIVIFETILGCSEVASIMAFACARGYTSETFYQAYGYLKAPPVETPAP